MQYVVVFANFRNAIPIIVYFLMNLHLYRHLFVVIVVRLKCLYYSLRLYFKGLIVISI